MTAPRQILRGATYHVTRRCAQRQFLLRPSQLTNNIFLFVLAVAASRYGIQVHAYCVLSNHYHLVVTDPHARLPLFLQLLDALVARAVNASLGRWEAFWAPASYSAERLVSPQDVVETVAYVLANPAAAGLVRTGQLWPGLWSSPERIGAGRVAVSRPERFFAKNGTMPAAVELELSLPPGFASRADFVAQVTTALAQREREAARRVGHRGFLGAAAVLKQRTTTRPSTLEPRRNLRPRIAARNTSHRIEALSRDKQFVRSYRRAWAARRRGETGVVFPEGTYLLRVLHGVRCAAAG